ncbi:carbohydrate ABC transporter permease [Paucibacter sp. M5-1]|uniref:carbohydrate ABC transporter permease n=1 Tax=Paucibacter sp. M5-1 TaxID=3015998 RepID=UPI0022B8B872|nr:carbohydrate ABC transporter permease [Paucibacter sp. M5-1]MCZ7883043.1 carbohydrate ABC transporter permease [Paucibacter sp. M5-1]
MSGSTTLQPVTAAAQRVAKRRRGFSPARLGVYAFLLLGALFFLVPLYVMLVTSLKSMDEIRESSIFALPMMPTIQPWLTAWSSACTGLECKGVQAGFWNSVMIVIPSTILSILVGAINGYALSLWRPRYANFLFAVLMIGVFVPAQVIMYPMVKLMSSIGLFGSLPALVLVHTIFGMPIMTLLFRNYYSSIPLELFRAARIDGGGFWRIFWHVMLPLSTPMLIVATIMQVTGIWNDYLMGLIFGGSDIAPMTVQLNNIVNSTFGERAYNVNMAATLLTSAVPLLIYLVSGRWFVRGIASGAVKG